MGMFDRFIVSPPIACPACNKPHIKELQTKAFPDPSLMRWSVGDEITASGGYDSEIELYVKDGWAACYEWCNESEAMVNYRAIVKDGKFVGVEFDRIWWRPRDDQAGTNTETVLD